MAIPQGPNQRWSLDFASDALSFGGRFRVLCVIDDFSRTCLAIVADTSLSGRRVERALDQIAEMRGRSCMVVLDDGTASTTITIAGSRASTTLRRGGVAIGQRMPKPGTDYFAAGTFRGNRSVPLAGAPWHGSATWQAHTPRRGARTPQMTQFYTGTWQRFAPALTRQSATGSGPYLRLEPDSAAFLLFSRSIRPSSLVDQT